jgi:hypothetical protein
MDNERNFEIVTKDEITGEEQVVKMHKYGEAKFANYDFETGEFETNIEGFTKEDFIDLLGPTAWGAMEKKNESG